MTFEFLRPLSDDFLQFIDGLSRQALGKKVSFFSGGTFESFSNYQIGIIGVLDNRGQSDGNDWSEIVEVRKAFYSLFPGNWTAKMIDFGDVLPGENLEDTYFVLKNLIAELIRNKIVPIVIGGSQDLTYPMYRAYDQLEQMVNLVCIDNKLDLVKEDSFPAESFLSRIIIEAPNNLFNYSNLGYQTYFNSQEEIDLIDKLYFEAYRVGEIANDSKLSEPVLRDADLVSIDMTAVKSADSGNFGYFNPNGFDGREICALSRYSGLSDRVSSFGVFNHNNSTGEALLVAQILWYFVEGFNFRANEYPFVSKESYFKYIVPVVDEDDLIFFKSDKTERWWIEVSFGGSVNDSIKRKLLLPCSYEDYLLATAQQVPERWWKAIKKSFL